MLELRNSLKAYFGFSSISCVTPLLARVLQKSAMFFSRLAWISEARGEVFFAGMASSSELSDWTVDAEEGRLRA